MAADDPASDVLPRIEPDRRDFTTGTGIVSRGKLQLEGGVDAQHSDSDRQLTLGELTLRIPLARDLEMHVGLPSYVISHGDRRQSGLDDAALELRYRFFNGDRLDWAVQATLVAPTGSRQVAERDWQPGAILAASLKLSEHAALITSVGGSRVTVDGTRFAQMTAATSLRVDVAASWNIFGEFYGFNRETPDGPVHKYADIGAVYFPSPSIALDARIGRGISNGDGPTTIASIGASRRF
jgi:Putative MetA-pathway of phenol degradation